ncbi:MAG: hypothetical protein IH969_03705, partial [Candidatus Krumholzibacteriota bacterium]|nr:hypothetical protein [Candidatus Krumholzibacteriota bacterium]
ATRHGKIARTPLLRALTIRWAMTIVATTLIASVFFTQRVPSSVPFGTGAVDATRHWLSGGAKPMWGFGWLLIMPLAIGVATVLGGGVLGAMLLCALLTHATVSASLIYANSTNLFPATLIAFSPWQWAFLVAAVLALPPLTTLSLGRLYRQPRVSFDPAADRRALILAGALFAFAIVLRLALSGVYSSLVLRWTLP